MAKSGFYLAVNGESSQSPTRSSHHHIARTTSLLEVQDLMKYHGDLTLGKKYGHLRKTDKELKAMKKDVRKYYEAFNQQVSSSAEHSFKEDNGWLTCIVFKAGPFRRDRVSGL
jgi:hypothetical protein